MIPSSFSFYNEQGPLHFLLFCLAFILFAQAICVKFTYVQDLFIFCSFFSAILRLEINRQLDNFFIRSLGAERHPGTPLFRGIFSQSLLFAIQQRDGSESFSFLLRHPCGFLLFLWIFRKSLCCSVTRFRRSALFLRFFDLEFLNLIVE